MKRFKSIFKIFLDQFWTLKRFKLILKSQNLQKAINFVIFQDKFESCKNFKSSFKIKIKFCEFSHTTSKLKLSQSHKLFQRHSHLLFCCRFFFCRVVFVSIQFRNNKNSWFIAVIFSFVFQKSGDREVNFYDKLIKCEKLWDQISEKEKKVNSEESLLTFLILHGFFLSNCLILEGEGSSTTQNILFTIFPCKVWWLCDFFRLHHVEIRFNTLPTSFSGSTESFCLWNWRQ